MKDTPHTADEWFRAAADASLDSLFVAKGVRDDAGRLVDFECIDVNGTALKLLGLAREKVLGQKLWGLLPVNREDCFDKYAQVLATGLPLEEEFPFDTAETKAKWLRHQVVRAGDGIAVFARDVTLRKEAESKLRESEERLRLATEAAHMGAWTWDQKTDRFSFSEGMGPVFGLPRGEGFHTPEELIKAVYPADRDIIARALTEGREKGMPVRVEVRTIWPDGTLHWVESESNFIRDAAGAVERGVGIAMDVTARKRAEEETRASEERYRFAMDAIQAGVWELDLTDNTAKRSPRHDAIFGYKELLPQWRYEMFLDHVLPAERAAVNEKFQEAIQHRTSWNFECRIRRTDDEVRWIRACGQHIINERGHPILLGMVEDITERKQAEESRLQFHAELSEAQRIARMANWQLDVATGNVIWSVELYRMLGLSPASTATNFTEQSRHFTPDSWARLSAAVSHTRETGAPFEIELEMVRADFSHGWMLARGEAIRDATGAASKLRGVALDISERKAGELALTRANRALRTLSACNAALIGAVSEPELLDTVCRLIVDAGGYGMAWVGFPEQSSEKRVRVVAQYGSTEEYLRSMDIGWADTEQGRGPTGKAIRSGKTQVNQSFLGEADRSPWHDAELAQGFQSSIALPLKELSGTLGALTLYARERDAFTEDEVRLLEELADDLAFGIQTLRTRAERDRMTEAQQHHEERLRKSLEESIQAISDTVEMRDPYTAGHQKRVGQLAVAIASDLGLPKDEIHGIHLAASIHDLGKIRVPAEILSKPGKLTEVELMLIKAHPQAGYDILRGIEFPWPIANIVLQHHEKLDGSGYPQGLKGNEILLGSRILAVADVLEAMASHRPYRPALGIDVALAEIERGRSTAFDPAVVDACLKLFREERFAFLA